MSCWIVRAECFLKIKAVACLSMPLTELCMFLSKPFSSFYIKSRILLCWFICDVLFVGATRPRVFCSSRAAAAALGHFYILSSHSMWSTCITVEPIISASVTESILCAQFYFTVDDRSWAVGCFGTVFFISSYSFPKNLLLYKFVFSAIFFFFFIV